MSMGFFPVPSVAEQTGEIQAKASLYRCHSWKLKLLAIFFFNAQPREVHFEDRQVIPHSRLCFL
jgi:hypothetical protein